MATRELIEQGQDLIAQIDYLDSRYYNPAGGYEAITFRITASGKVVLDAQKLIDEAPTDIKAGIEAAITAALETAFSEIESYIDSTKTSTEADLASLGET